MILHSFESPGKVPWRSGVVFCSLWRPPEGALIVAKRSEVQKPWAAGMVTWWWRCYAWGAHEQKTDLEICTDAWDTATYVNGRKNESDSVCMFLQQILKLLDWSLMVAVTGRGQAWDMLLWSPVDPSPGLFGKSWSINNYVMMISVYIYIYMTWYTLYAYAYMYVYTHSFEYSYEYSCTHTRTCTCTRTFPYVYVYIHICICIRTYTPIHCAFRVKGL